MRKKSFTMGIVNPGMSFPETGRCPIPGNTQEDVGWGFEQPDQVKDIPTHHRGSDLVTFKGPFQPKLLYDFSVLKNYTCKSSYL